MGAMTAQRQAVFWACVLGVLVLSLWVLGSMLLPFVLGMAVGYLLDPVVDRIARRGVSRGAAAGVLILGSYALATMPPSSTQWAKVRPPPGRAGTARICPGARWQDVRAVDAVDIDKITLSIDRPKLTPEDEKKLMAAQRDNKTSE